MSLSKLAAKVALILLIFVPFASAAGAQTTTILAITDIETTLDASNDWFIFDNDDVTDTTYRITAQNIATAFEGFMQLQDLQGAVTDAQVPDTITVSNYLQLAGGTLTGSLITDNLGIEFASSDTNPSCSAGEFKIFADLSELALKKCTNGTVEDLDTTGGTPAFSAITTSTNTTATMTCGAGCTITYTSTGTILATDVDINAITTENAIDSANDLLVFHDASGSARRKATIDEILGDAGVESGPSTTVPEVLLWDGDEAAGSRATSAANWSELETAISTPQRSVVWSAAGMSADGTQCADPTEVTINSGPKQYTIICTDNAASIIYGSVAMPDGYDGGTVTFELQALNTAADTNVLDFDFSCQARGDSDTVNSTWGTAANAAITFSTANDIEHATTAAVTCDGTPAAGDTIFWRAVMDDTATTTAVATAHVMFVKMEYTSSLDDQ